MKSVIIACLLLSVVFASSSNMDSLWDQWKAKYNVQYPTAQEDAHRFAVFCKNYEFIQEFNANHPNTKLALNKFSAYTNDEFRALFTGYNHGQFDASSAYTVSLDDKTTSTTESSKKASSASKTSSKSASKSASNTASKTASQSDSKTSSKASSKSESKTESKKASSVPGLWGSATTGEMQGTEFDSAHSIFTETELLLDEKAESFIPVSFSNETVVITHDGVWGSATTSEMEGTEFSSNYSSSTTEDLAATSYAASWNWVQQGALNAVQNQEQCGSCWSFSTTAAMEALYKINTGKLLKFSEQQLVDCDRMDYGCNGGSPVYAMQYVQSQGQELESSYPYIASVGTCTYNAAKAIQGITTGPGYVQSNSVPALKAAIYQVPTVVAVEATNVLQSYQSGVLDNTSGCTANLDHAVLAVGYGPYAGQDTFMVRNSWGADWGVNGYFYISTNYDNNGAGTCGILGYPVAPTGRKVAH